jgi:hypothetical protein
MIDCNAQRTALANDSVRAQFGRQRINVTSVGDAKAFLRINHIKVLSSGYLPGDNYAGWIEVDSKDSSNASQLLGGMGLRRRASKLSQIRQELKVSIRWDDLTKEKQTQIEQDFLARKMGDIDEIDYTGEKDDGVLGEITITSI